MYHAVPASCVLHEISAPVRPVYSLTHHICLSFKSYDFCEETVHTEQALSDIFQQPVVHSLEQSRAVGDYRHHTKCVSYHQPQGNPASILVGYMISCLLTPLYTHIPRALQIRPRQQFNLKTSIPIHSAKHSSLHFNRLPLLILHFCHISSIRSDSVIYDRLSRAAAFQLWTVVSGR